MQQTKNNMTKMFKKAQGVISAFAIVLSGAALLVRVIPAHAAVSVNIAYSPASQTIAQDGTVAMAIQITGSQQVQGVQLRVTFDATKLQYQSISYGSALDYTDPTAGLGGSGANSYFQINQAKLGVAPTPPFMLATITFKALAISGSTTVGYDSANSAAYDTSANASPIAGLTTATYSFRDGANPSVSVTAPANGAAVSGSTSFTANASDNVGVSRVEFYVDGTIKATDTSAPYAATIDTAALSNASHVFMAKAYDAAGNSASATSTVTVRNGSTSPAGSGSPSSKPSSGSPTGSTPTNSSSPANTNVANQQPVTTDAGNGVQTTQSPYAVTTLKDKPVAEKSTNHAAAIIGASVAVVGALVGGFALYRIVLQRKLVMRHVATVPTGVTPYDYQHQPPIAPGNIPQGSTVVRPTEHHDPNQPNNFLGN